MPRKQSRGDKVHSEILVSYTNHNKEFVEKVLLDRLRKAGLDVWSEAPDAVNSQRGQALLGCHVYIPVMCSKSVLDSKLQDEVALAYISNKTIIPLGREFFRKVDANTSSGIKLMLAKINWTFFVKEELFEDTMTKLIEVIEQELTDRKNATPPPCPETEDEAFDALNNHAPGIPKPDIDGLEEAALASGSHCEQHEEQNLSCDFWDRNFNEKTEVQWTEFKDCFQGDYDEKIIDFIGEERAGWMVNILYKDIFDLNKTISKRRYLVFCGKNTTSDPHHFFERLKEYCRGSFAIREVFDMDSSVRLHAIKNLATFNNSSVITLLFDLVSDNDANTRAVAALALAKTGKKYKKITDKLIKLLEDEDRVVRESACLSLAHMRCTAATPNIVDLWRNDAIKHVREAAELALTRIGGEQAEEAIRVTKVLTDEMTNLKQSKIKSK